MTGSRAYSLSGVSECTTIPQVLTPQPEGGFTVTSPPLPELITEGERLSQNRRGLAHFAESSEQNVPVPLSSRGFGTVSEITSRSVILILRYELAKGMAIGKDRAALYRVGPACRAEPAKLAPPRPAKRKPG